MKLNQIKEPKLEFGRGEAVCPRMGIAMHDVYDARFSARRDRVLVGAIGTSDSLDQLSQWLDRCSRPIPGALNSRQPNLRFPFCGFNRSVGFKAEFAIESAITRSLSNSDVREIIKIKDWEKRVEAAVELYYRHIKFLTQNRVVDVVACIIPDDLYNKVVSKEKKKPELEEAAEDDAEDEKESNFRRALKAKAMHLGKPLQLFREHSFQSDAKGLQDDATKAWNFCTALYYKANQTVPWRLVTDRNRPSVCFVGIGFYRSRDGKVLNTSLAQIFDELGNGVILRGTPVDVSKEDRKPHLTAQQAYNLLSQALEEYEVALDNSPSRLVIHKSSNFNQAELDGFRQAANAVRTRSLDFVTLLDPRVNLFRDGAYPPYRGTHIEFDKKNHLLYTRGSVDHYKTYTGLYIPQPLEIRIVESDESPGLVCTEILGLTKMNWNNTQFDGKYPITIGCARRVGQVMKYLGENDVPQINYSYYM